MPAKPKNTITQTRKDDEVTVSTISPSKTTNMRCYHCGQRGHIARICPKKNEISEVQTIQTGDEDAEFEDFTQLFRALAVEEEEEEETE